MLKRRKNRIGLLAGIGFGWILFLAGCARFGSAPTGGPRDLAPPTLLKALPKEGSRDFEAKKIVLDFDEYIVLQQTDKIVTSPVLSKVSYQANLKQVVVSIEDTLLPDKTYSINFKDAIGDLHEATPLKDYTYYFSTGSRLDSGRIVGTVRDALTLDPVKEASVMLYATRPEGYPVEALPDYVAITDTGGLFRAEYLKEGCYYLLVSSDENRNYLVEPTEEKMAFSSGCWQTQPYKPPVYFQKKSGVKESDTAMRYAYDSALQARRREDLAEIRNLDRTLFLYQDKLAEVFLKEAKWTKKGEIDLNWYYGLDYDSLRVAFLPSYNDIELLRQIEATQEDTVQEARKNRRQHRLQEEEIPDLSWPEALRFALVGQDDPLSAKVYFNNYKVNDLRLVLQYGSFSDTAELMLPEGAQNVRDTSKFTVSARQTNLFYADSLILDFSFPLVGIDWEKAIVTQYYKKEDGTRDTVVPAIPDMAYRQVKPNRLALFHDWQPGHSYQFFVPSACFTDFFGRLVDTTAFTVNCPSLETYGQVQLQIRGLDTAANYVLQLVNSSKAVLQSRRVPENGVVEFAYVQPGYVGFVLIRDDNGNGQWDAGSYPEGGQPEGRWLFPKVLLVEGDWRIEETWRL